MQDNIIKVAVIVSRFNEPITTKLYQGAVKYLNQQGVWFDTFWVPGAVEIPLIAQQCAKLKEYDAILCYGAVIRGETSHYDYVCQQVSDGCQRVALDFDLPVIFGVLTTENVEQALDRVGGRHGHKGEECAAAAMDMVNLVRRLQRSECLQNNVT